MRTTLALLVKFALTWGAAVIAGYLAGVVDWGFFFMLALIGTTANYLIGDLMILPAAGNIIASVMDGGLAGILAYWFAVRSRTFDGNMLLFAVIFGVIVMVAEFFFHIYLKSDRKVAP